jgi:hypothetical protein
MTSIAGSRAFGMGGAEMERPCLMTKNLDGQMNEPGFRDYPSAPGSAARSQKDRKNDGIREAADGHAHKLAVGEDDSGRDAGVRRSPYDQGPNFRRIIRWYSFSGSPSQHSLFVDRDFRLAHRHERIMRQ